MHRGSLSGISIAWGALPVPIVVSPVLNGGFSQLFEQRGPLSGDFGACLVDFVVSGDEQSPCLVDESTSGRRVARHQALVFRRERDAGNPAENVAHVH